jgi:hypothetical protein
MAWPLRGHPGKDSTSGSGPPRELNLRPNPVLIPLPPSLPIIILPDPPEIMFCMEFLGIDVSSGPVLRWVE